MKEIVFIRQSADEVGGVENQIIILARHLFNRKRLRPVLITSDKRSVFAQTFAEYGFEVLAVPMSRAKIFSASKILSAAARIEKLLKGRNVAAIQTHLFRESLIGRAVRRKRTDIPHILRAQTYINCSKNSKAAKSFYYLLDRATSKYVDFYIANGKYLTEEIITCSQINPNKVTTVLDGCDSVGTPDKPVEIFGQPLPAKIALIANLKPGKGHDCLIQALALLKNQNLKITARLIGGESTGYTSNSKTSDTANQIKNLARQCGIYDQIEFYGYTKDIHSALEVIPVVVLPSDSEGVPNCILEAMSLRKLVIVSDTGGVGEIIEHGKTGWTHKPKDYSDLAEILKNAFTTPAQNWEQMRTTGFARWQAEFTGEKMVNKFIEIYQKLGVL